MFPKIFSGVFIGLLVVVVLVLPTTAEAQAEKFALCHATSSETNPYTYHELPRAPIYGPGGHFNENGTPQAGHEDDFFPVDNDCNRANDPGQGPGPDPAPTPEPVTILLFGAGLAGVGYASRRFFKKQNGIGSTEE